MKLPKKIASLLTVTLVAGCVLGNLTTVDAAEGVSSDTLKGNGRWETAIEISKKGWTKAKEAVIVNDNSLADALTATPFAEAKDAPILLTQNNKLDDRTKAELKRLGVTKVYLIGGENSLNKSVESALNSEKISTDRIWGNTRYETSLELAKRIDDIKKVSEISVVNGEKSIVDAISVAPVAADKDMPILLASPSKGTEVADKFIAEKSIKSSYVIGGTNSVSNEIANKLPNATRVEGIDRNETNAKVIETFYTEKELKNVYVAKNGMTKEDELIDGLAVGVLAAKNDSPVLLVGKNLSQGQKDVTNTKTFKTITQVGGGSNEASFNELKTMQEVTTYNVSTVAKLNEAMAKADANDVINMAPAALNKTMTKADANSVINRASADINEEIVIKTNKAIAINLSGNYKNTITVSAPNASIVNKGTISKIVVKDSVGGKIENTSGAIITDIEVQGSASNVEVVNKGTVTNVKNDAPGTVINNSGTITNNPTGNQTPSIDGNRPGGSTGGGGGGSVSSVANVTDLPGLKTALKDTSIKTININKSIGNDIDGIDERIEVDREVTINGHGNTLTFSKRILDYETGLNGILITKEGKGTKIDDLKVKMKRGDEWKGVYGIQVYDSTRVTLNNVSSSGGDGGILVNGSEVTLTGTVDVSGNEFGGIEVSKGKEVDSDNLKLTVNGTVTYYEESKTKPVIWIDGYACTDNTVELGGLEEGVVDLTNNKTLKGDNACVHNEGGHKDKHQYFYTDPTVADVSDLDGLKSALEDDSIKKINITESIGNDIDGIDERIEVDRAVTINGHGNTLTFSKRILDYETGLNGILITKEGKGTKIDDLKVKMKRGDEWKGVYGIQVYDSTRVTLNNVSSSGGDGGILVNGSEVTLTGTVDVSGNEFGGIEVSKGKEVDSDNLKLTVNGTVTYYEESKTKPVIWIDGYACTDNTVELGGLEEGVVDLTNNKTLKGDNACVHNEEGHDDKHQYFFFHTDIEQ
ncbi:cell wall-binding repeat-containing protein [Clostridioides mangenotii]|uniref:cell wall-binding repeat-containing protein n=1 Tax=Metaclostridioides mangenotii TaxID=1540 RepID=UPI00214A83BE|nr:cell wall-binding repeat-containing protein [Clostridioides mangenotii]MCR1954492.1 cell wall-binding repeat-containing protein [Clostridioides mangenotii]